MIKQATSSSLGDRIAPPLLLVIHSARWQSQMRRLLEGLEPHCSPEWLLTIDQTSALAHSNRAAAIVVETPANFASKPEPTLLQVARLCNNPQQCPLFLLGDASVEPWSDVFREAGAREVCTSMLRFENFGLRVARHLENHLLRELTVEQTVVARLPW